MQCSRCRAENRAGRRFCAECGASLAVACAGCGFSNEPGEKFCGGCGRPLHADPPAVPKFSAPDSYTPRHLAEKILTSRSALEGERKQVTVLFADLKGSMELLADRDPEEARRILDPVLERLMEAVHRYEGTVNQVMGDGIMALFGAPLAHEDHAVRACYAAMRMQESVTRYAEETRRATGTPVSIRVGLNSGEVVVRSIGSDLRMDYTAVGQTTHLAARMEQAALPGSIVITRATLRLADGYVNVKPLGPTSVKGLSEPVDSFEVTGAGPIRRRSQALASGVLSRFVGRHAEIEHLARALQRAGEGRGQLVAVIGEPGIGKSRLFYEFSRSHHASGWLVLESGAVSYGKTTPYLPVTDLLKTYFKIEDRDDQRRVREKITGKLFTLDRAFEASVPAFLALFDVPVDDHEWRASDPQQRRRRTLDAVKRLLLAESRVQPVLLVLEDLHWVDGETQILLDTLIESLPAARVLVLVNYRPEYEHAWSQKTYYAQMRIDPLPSESADEFLGALLGHDPELDPLKRLLIERTEGNPFFLEESVRALVETGALVGERGAYRAPRAVRTVDIPATAQAILAARIDRLPPGHKRVLQAASVIGKDVSFPLLQAIAEEEEDALRRVLADLQVTEFLYEARIFPDVEYTFKHALTHDVTYGTLLQDRRRALHARIVSAMEELHRDRLGEQIELLAHHAVLGEAWEKALVYLREAGTKAFVRSAHADAIGYVKRGLEIVSLLPESADRQRHELALLLALGPAIQALDGLGAPEAERVFVRARELAECASKPEPAFQALWGHWMVTAGLGRVDDARRIGGELLTLAERTNDRALRLEAHHAMWATSFWLGELIAAERHVERGLDLYDPEHDRPLAFLYGGHDPASCGRQFTIWTHWLAGRPIQAATVGDAALTRARQLGQPVSLAQVLAWRCTLFFFERNGPATMYEARQLMDLATERELPPWHAAGVIFDGWGRAESGDGTGGIEQIRNGLRAARTTGTLLPLEPLYLMFLAEACLKHRRIEEGLQVTDEALALMSDGRVRVWRSEFHRLKGELLLLRSPSDRDAIEQLFRRALATAREHRARSWELRAATSLSRLLVPAGRRDEARRVLADVLGGFTEGHETANLVDAQALLAELS